MTHKSYHQKGLGMVEIIVVVAVILVAFTAILQLFTLQAQIERVKREELVAYAFLSEALEAVRSVRDDSWTNISSLTAGADYYPEIFASAWTLASIDPGPVDGYSRWITLAQVRRDDTSDDIVPSGCSGCYIDLDTLLITAYVEWQSGGSTKTKNLTTYLTNWQENL